MLAWESGSTSTVHEWRTIFCFSVQLFHLASVLGQALRRTLVLRVKRLLLSLRNSPGAGIVLQYTGPTFNDRPRLHGYSVLRC